MTRRCGSATGSFGSETLAIEASEGSDGGSTALRGLGGLAHSRDLGSPERGGTSTRTARWAASLLGEA